MPFNQQDTKTIEALARRIARDEMRSTVTKGDLDAAIKKEFDQFLKDKKLDKKIDDNVKDILVNFHKALWTKKTFWLNNLNE